MYRVIWRHAAIDELTRVYTAVFEARGDTAGLTRAVAEADRVLGNNPGEQGESRDRHERVVVAGPLSVVYEVYDADRVVFVASMGYSTLRKDR